MKICIIERCNNERSNKLLCSIHWLRLKKYGKIKIIKKITKKEKRYIIRKQQIKEKREGNPRYRLNSNISTAITVSLKGNRRKRGWEKLTGYTLNKLKIHLEKQFTKKMNWNNYGSYWHLDHIIPKCQFEFKNSSDKEFKKCWALKNLQPLDAVSNLKKSKKKT